MKIYLAVALLLGGALSSAPSQPPIDLALINGRVWTGESGTSFAEAIAVRGNQIARVGTTAEIKSLINERTEVIDLNGRLVAPGFNDAHIHFLGGALGLTEVDLTGAKTVAEMTARVTAYLQKHPDKEWITGAGWEYARFAGGLPTKGELDAVSPDRPVYLRAYDGHSAWANSKALQLAGITRETKFDGFGEIVRDAAGEPTGALKEGAQSLISRLVPKPTRADKLAALRQGLKLAASLGLTSLQNASGSVDDWALYEELLQQGELTARVGMAFSVGARTTPEEIARFVALKNKYDLNPRLRAGAVKMMLDGVIESHTAAMLDHYSDLPANAEAPTGKLTMTPDVYRALVTKFDALGFQIYTHAIGDLAVREALNAYENAQRANQRKNARHRIEHIEVVAPADLPRFANLGVLASMEPIHADPGTVEVWSKAVGAQRLPLAFAWASLLKSGARLVFSSDWPAAISVDPMRGLHNAVNRRTIDGQPPRGWVAEQRLDMGNALRAYTQSGAYASFEEGIKGRLAPGMLADLIVLSQDLFTVDPLKVHETRVVLTVFDGKVIYRGGTATL
jgi:predicted amidohydrolase YtcJ